MHSRVEVGYRTDDAYSYVFCDMVRNLAVAVVCSCPPAGCIADRRSLIDRVAVWMVQERHLGGWGRERGNFGISMAAASTCRDQESGTETRERAQWACVLTGARPVVDTGKAAVQCETRQDARTRPATNRVPAAAPGPSSALSVTTTTVSDFLLFSAARHGRRPAPSRRLQPSLLHLARVDTGLASTRRALLVVFTLSVLGTWSSHPRERVRVFHHVHVLR